MNELTLVQPDDWHIHLRDGDALKTTVPHVAQHFARAIVMPNLTPPVTTVAGAEAYRERILAQVPSGTSFEPLMVLYLTDHTDPAEIRLAAESTFVHAVKLYPAGATTNSASGLTDIANAYSVLEVMQEVGLPLLIHGEVTDGDIDVFDREATFIERTLRPLVEKFPGLKIVFEHITTEEAAEFVLAAPDHIAATITPQHLIYNRSDLLVGGIKPHRYCLPVLKRETHRLALVEAATSGNPKFFLGTDSAPHAKHTKESSCGCAGCYTAPHAMALYAQVFEAQDALDKLEAFASLNGPSFYGHKPNARQLRLTKADQLIDQGFDFLGDQKLDPLMLGETLSWHAELIS